MSSIIPRVDSLSGEELIEELADDLHQLDEIDADAERLLAGLNDDQFHWSPVASRWSIAQCVVHLTIVGRIYLPVVDLAIAEANSKRLISGGPFHYGFLEQWFVRSAEPPPRIRLRTPVSARPPDDQPLEIVLDDFISVQQELRQRIRTANGLDLARAKVAAPFMKSLRLGLGLCFAFLAAHERRHLWQAWQVRSHPEFPPG
jgi:DinB family protein